MVQPCPHGRDRDPQKRSDLLARIAFNLKKNERAAPLFAHPSEDAPDELPLLLLLQELGWTRRRALDGVELYVAPGDDQVPEPGLPSMIADRVRGNSVQPRPQIASIETTELAPHDQEDLLGQVLAVGLGPSERADPALDLVEVLVINGRKIGEVERFDGQIGNHR